MPTPAQDAANPLRMLADWKSKVVFDVVAPENQQYRGLTVGEIAAQTGRDPFDALCEIAVADELLTSFGTPTPVESVDDWNARLEVWRDERAVIGASDAGAHFDLLGSFNYTTGVLREGWHADVIVIDPETVGTDDIAMRFDLPGGQGRLYAESTGIDHVFVNGTPIVTDGALTTNRRGTLLRAGRDTETPALA
jgi:N-acyl-D-aspartate/D-glutamate deacylase